MPTGVYKRTEEQKKNIGLALRGKKKKPFTIEHKRNISLFKKGKSLSKQHKENIGKANLGHKMYAGSESGWFKKGHIGYKATLGKKLSEETKKRISKNRKGKYIGKENNFWKGGITLLVRAIRTCYEYRQWRSDVFTRDNFTCQKCGKSHCWVEAHHIKEFNQIVLENNIKSLGMAKECQELWNINNGITLCKECHQLTKNGRLLSKIKND